MQSNSIELNAIYFIIISDEPVQGKLGNIADIEMSLGQNAQYENLSTAGQHPIVTILVDSPRDSPKDEKLPAIQQSENQPQSIATDLYNEPIDVNLPCDTTNVFYEYPIESSSTSTGIETSIVNINEKELQKHDDTSESNVDNQQEEECRRLSDSS